MLKNMRKVLRSHVFKGLIMLKYLDNVQIILILLLLTKDVPKIKRTKTPTDFHLKSSTFLPSLTE